MAVTRKGGGLTDGASPPLVATAVFLVDALTLQPESGASTTLTQFTTALSASTAISVKVTPGNLMALSCSNANAAVRFLQIHNRIVAPINADAPVAAWPIPAGSANSPGYVSLSVLDFGNAGFACAAGISIGISTTLATYTAATASEHVANGSFI